MQTARPVPLKQPFDLFPTRINEWVEKQEQAAFGAEAYIQPDVFLSRTYLSRRHGSVSLYIGYFEQQELNRKLLNYRTTGLERGAKMKSINFRQHGRKDVRTAVSIINGKPTQLLFWYHMSGSIIANGLQASLKTAVNNLAHGIQNGALVVISQKIADGTVSEQALGACETFAKEIAPLIDQFVP